MTVEDQRKLGVMLASRGDAPKTLALIKDPDSRYADIFACAEQEVGIERLAPVILEHKDPNWALYALRQIADVGEFKAPLIELASLLTKNIKDSSNGTPPEMKRIKAFQLNVIGGASYAASFTMYWFDPVYKEEPQSGYSNPADYKFSNQIPVLQSTSEPCSYFALPHAPLNPNSTVWMIVALCGGSWWDTQFKFTYDPLSTQTAIISASGGLASPVFSVEVVG